MSRVVYFSFLCLQWLRLSVHAWVAPSRRDDSLSSLQILPHRRASQTRCAPWLGDEVAPPAGTFNLAPIAIASDADDVVALPGLPLVLITALALFVAAQGWINRQAGGDQGLGAFMQDGRGFGKSALRPFAADDERAVSSDPLPWLRLPELDFVEVAGQEELKLERERQEQIRREQEVISRLENLREQMTQQLEQGNKAEAIAIRSKLEILMKENGFEFEGGDSN